MGRPTAVEAKQLLMDITLAGFKQIGKDNDGFVYKMGTIKVTVPYAIARGLGTPSAVDEIRSNFVQGLARHELIHDVQAQAIKYSTEHLLGKRNVASATQMGQAFERVVVKQAQAEIPPPEVAPEAPASSEPTTDLQEEESATMPPSNAKSLRQPRKCPKCGKEYTWAPGWGRHVKFCSGSPTKGKRDYKGERVRAAARARAEEIASTNGSGVVEAFRSAHNLYVSATADLLSHLGNLETEVKLMRLERDELAKFKDQLASAFGVLTKRPS